MTAEMIAPLIVGFLLTCAGSTIGFFVHRYFTSRDEARKALEAGKAKAEERLDRKIETDIGTLIERVDTVREDIGQIKMVDKAIWRAIEEIRVDMREMRARQDRFSER